jgi:hypothetical protein
MLGAAAAISPPVASTAFKKPPQTCPATAYQGHHKQCSTTPPCKACRFKLDKDDSIADSDQHHYSETWPWIRLLTTPLPVSAATHDLARAASAGSRSQPSAPLLPWLPWLPWPPPNQLNTLQLLLPLLPTASLLTPALLLLLLLLLL